MAPIGRTEEAHTLSLSPIVFETNTPISSPVITFFEDEALPTNSTPFRQHSRPAAGGRAWVGQEVPEARKPRARRRSRPRCSVVDGEVAPAEEEQSRVFRRSLGPGDLRGMRLGVIILRYLGSLAASPLGAGKAASARMLTVGGQTGCSRASLKRRSWR